MARAQDKLRAFLAIELPGDVRDAMGELIERLRVSGAKASWMKAKNLHLTLRFLGEDVEESRIDQLRTALAPKVANIEPFELNVRGVGAFPKPSRPKVIWTGIEDPSGQLLEVQALTEEAARGVGLEADSRRFTPHITLGRVREGRPVQGLIDAIDSERDFRGGDFTARAVSLFSSKLTSQGAIHHRLFELPFSWNSISESPTAP